MKNESINILVTGAGGNVGKYIAQSLYGKGCRVIGTYRNNKPQKRNYELIHIDLAEMMIDLKNIDVIIHTAARLYGSTKELVKDNIFATMNLLKAAEQSGVRRFVYLSTISVYGRAEGELNIDSDIINSETYGETKYLAECLVKESSIPEKMVIGLPRMLGPFVDLENADMSGFLTMAKRILNDEDVICYIPDVLYNNYMHVMDLTCFIESLLIQPQWSNYSKVLLGAGEKLSMMEILQVMKNAIHSNSKIIAKNIGEKPKCALISISRAAEMGYKPLDSKEILRCFMRELKANNI